MKRIIPEILLCLSASLLAAQINPPARRTCQVDGSPLSDADVAMLKEDFSRAHHLYEKQAEAEPDNLIPQAEAISALLRWKHVDEAVDTAVRMVQSHPDSSVAQSALAEAHWFRGDSNAALAAVSRALSLDPCNFRALSQAATIERAAGQGASAAQHAQLAHQLSPLRVTDIWAATRPIVERAQAYDAIASNTPAEAAEQKSHYAAFAEETRQILSTRCTVAAAHPRIHLDMNRVIPNHDIFGDPLGLDVKINGHARTLVLGNSDVIILSKDQAKGVDLNERVPLYTRVATGESSPRTEFSRIASLKIGDLEYHNCPVVIIDDDRVRGGQIPVGFFGDFITTINFARREMQIDALPEPVEGSAAHWSHAAMDGKEHPSINGGDWPNQMAGRPAELADWTAIYRLGSLIAVPAKIDPVHIRLFLGGPDLSHQIVSSQTAKDALPVSQYPGTDKQFQKMLGGAKYALQFDGIIQPIENWHSTPNQLYGGVLGEEFLGKARISLDLRDNLAVFQRAEK